MSQKNETTILILSLIITSILTTVSFWWFTSRTGLNTSNSISDRSSYADKYNRETFAEIQGVPKGLFNYGGSTTWATIRKEIDPALQTVWPQFRLCYTQPNISIPSSGTGIQMLLDNQLSFAQSSVSIQDKDHEKAKQKGFTLVEVPVAIDAFAAVVHPNLNIPGITVAQLNDIYAGKITNWQEVGGPNPNIKAYRKGTPDSESHLEFVPTTTDALRKVANESGAIFQASAPLLISQCKVKPLPLGRTSHKFITPYKEPFIPLSECPNKRNQVNLVAFQSGEYPLTRRLFVVIKKNGQLDERAGEAYANLLLTNQGQELIEKAGFVRIR